MRDLSLLGYLDRTSMNEVKTLEQAKIQFLFVSAGLILGCYTSDMYLQHHNLCPSKLPLSTELLTSNGWTAE